MGKTLMNLGYMDNLAFLDCYKVYLTLSWINDMDYIL